MAKFKNPFFNKGKIEDIDKPKKKKKKKSKSISMKGKSESTPKAKIKKTAITKENNRFAIKILLSNH